MRLRVGLCALSLWLSGCGAQGCTAPIGAPLPTQVPDELMLPAATQVRVSQHGFDVVADHIVQWMSLLFGSDADGDVVIDTTALLGSAPFKFAGGLSVFQGSAEARELILSLDLASLKVKLVEGSSPARVRLAIDHADIGVVEGVVAGSVTFLGLTSNAACHLLDGLDVGGPDQRLATLSAFIDLVLDVDGDGALAIGVEIIDPVLHEVGFRLGKDCKLPECSDQVFAEDPCGECVVCDAGELGSDAVVGLKGLLGPLMKDILTLVGNLLVDQVLAGLNGQPLDIEVPLDLRDLLAQASPVLAGLLGDGGPLIVRARPAPDAFRVHAGGLELRMDSAAFATARPCATRPGPDAPAIFATLVQGVVPALPDQMQTSTADGTTLAQPVDVGLLLSRAVLEEALWAAARSGALCLEVDAEALWELSGGRLLLSAAVVDLLLPGLRQLATPAAPVRIALVPDADPAGVPRIGISPGDSDGVRLDLALYGNRLRLEVATQGRWLTVLEARVDLEIGLHARIDAAGALQIDILEAAVPAVDVLRAPLFEANAIEKIVPAITSLAVSILLAQPIHFALDPAALLAGIGDLPLTARPIGLAVAGDEADWLVLGVALDDSSEAP